MTTESSDDAMLSNAGFGRREMLRVGAAAAAIAAGAVILGTARTAVAAGRGAKGALESNFRVTLSGAVLPKIRIATIEPLLFKTVAEPLDQGFAYTSDGFGDLDVVLEQDGNNATLESWFNATLTDSNPTSRQLVVEAVSPNRSLVVKAWTMMVLPKLRERVATAKTRATSYRLRGAFSA